jgi:hypothetical protein
MMPQLLSHLAQPRRVMETKKEHNGDGEVQISRLTYGKIRRKR